VRFIIAFFLHKSGGNSPLGNRLVTVDPYEIDGPREDSNASWPNRALLRWAIPHA